MSRRFKYVGIVLLAIVSAFILTMLLMLVLRVQTAGSVGFGIYFLIPIVLLVWSIISYTRHQNGLFLTFSITLVISMILFFALLIFVILMALKSFT